MFNDSDNLARPASYMIAAGIIPGLLAIALGYTDDTVSSMSRYADLGEAVTNMRLVPEGALPEAGFPMPTS